MNCPLGPSIARTTMPRSLPRKLIRVVRERDGSSCQNCYTSERRLEVHHIDQSGCTTKPNNDLNNLILLCSKCHGIPHRRRRSGYAKDMVWYKEYVNLSGFYAYLKSVARRNTRKMFRERMKKELT